MIEIELMTRAHCGLCEEMKVELKRAVSELHVPVRVCEVDVDTDPDLTARYGADVPVLLIDGVKAFEHRASAEAIRNRLSR